METQELMGQILFLSSGVVFGMLINRVTRLDLTLSCLTAGVVAAILYYGIGSPGGFPWMAALLAGAILAATDPVAVVSSLKRLDAPEDLTALVEGESLFNALIFVLMGLVITFEMFSAQWLAIAIAIPASLIGRALAVFSCGAMTRPLARPIPMGWQYILVWGGLRGAIAVVLVLSLPTSLPYWWTIQSMVFGVVLFSLLVQGTTTGPLIRRYR